MILIVNIINKNNMTIAKGDNNTCLVSNSFPKHHAHFSIYFQMKVLNKT